MIWNQKLVEHEKGYMDSEESFELDQIVSEPYLDNMVQQYPNTLASLYRMKYLIMDENPYDHSKDPIQPENEYKLAMPKRKEKRVML